MVIQHNLQAMNANRMLSINSKASSHSTEKLSSGYRINRAADDAAGLAISEKMRKQMRGLKQASSNAEDGISCVQTAEGAMAEVQDMLQRMNELAVQAANGTNSETDRQYIQDEIDQLVTEIDRVSETTKFNEIYLLKGDKETNGTTNRYVTKYVVNFTKNTSTKAGQTQPEVKYNYTGHDNIYMITTDMVTSASINPASSDLIQNGADITEYLNQDATDINTASYTAFANASLADSDIQTGTTKANTDLYFYDTKTKTVSHFAAGEEVGLYLADTGGIKSDYRLVKKLDDVGITIADVIERDKSENVVYDADGEPVSGMALYKFYDDKGNYQGGLFKTPQARVEDAIVDTATYVSHIITKVANELEFDLHVGADSDKENKIKTSIISLSSAGLGIDKLHSRNIGIVDNTGANATDAIDVIASALQTLSTQRSLLGAVQNRLEHSVKNLDNVVENTTAAESAIRDTDMAEEMVAYSNNNVLLQAGQSMLAQANQANQGILSLLQ